MSAPNQKVGTMWQDPLLGYYETHGKMAIKPGETYDISPKQQQAVMERYRMKELLKMEYFKREFDPLKRRYAPGVVVDPAMFRWYAADMSHVDVFRFSPKTVFWALAAPIFPLIAYGYFYIKTRSKWDDKCRAGDRLWWDRQERIVTLSGPGPMQHNY